MNRIKIIQDKNSNNICKLINDEENHQCNSNNNSNNTLENQEKNENVEKNSMNGDMAQS